MAPKLPSLWRISEITASALVKKLCSPEESLSSPSFSSTCSLAAMLKKKKLLLSRSEKRLLVLPCSFPVSEPPSLSWLHGFPLQGLKLPGAALLENNLSKNQLQLSFSMSAYTSVSLDIETSPRSLVLIYLSNCPPFILLKDGLVGICSFFP